MAELGCTVLDADSIVADLYRPEGAAVEPIRQRFGNQAISADGSVNKVRLAARVFDSDEARHDLEKIVHPLVVEELAPRIAATDGVVVYEVPLLAETGGGGRFDVVVTVEAPTELRVRRAIDRGLEEAAVRARMAAQASEAERVAIADEVIRNDGGREQLRLRVEDLVERLKRRLEP